MKKRTEFLCTVLVVLLAALASCQKKGGDMAASGSGAESYKIGLYATLTGPGAAAADQQLKGTAVALSEINAAGGVKGRPLEYIAYDDASTPEGAVRAVTRLIESDKVDLIAGDQISPHIIATIPYSENAKVLQVAIGTSPSWTNAGHKYLFRATTNAQLPVKTFIDKMLEMGEKTTAIISLETEYGQSGKKVIMDMLGPAGIKVIAEVTYQLTETDFTGQISRLMAPNPDSIIMWGNGTEMSLILKQLRQHGFNKFVYTGEGGANTDILTVAGPSADGLIFGCAYVSPENIESATSDLERAYLEKYVALHKEMPLSDMSYRAYDQIRLIGIALNNSTDISNRDANRDAFLKISNYTGLAGKFDFTAGTGDGLTSSNAYMISGQKIKAFDKAAMEQWKAAQK